MQQFINEYLDGHQKVLAKLEAVAGDIQQAAERCIAALANGHKLLICGNGGSAADAQHMAAELVGRFIADRRALAAIALTTDTSRLQRLPTIMAMRTCLAVRSPASQMRAMY